MKPFLMDNPYTMMRELWVSVNGVASKIEETPAMVFMTAAYRNKEDAPWGWYPYSPPTNPYEEAEKAALANAASEE